MTSQSFCYWLQGFFEIGGSNAQISPAQVAIIRNHLNMVFVHEIDPSIPDPNGTLQSIHDSKESLINFYDGTHDTPSMRC